MNCTGSSMDRVEKDSSGPYASELSALERCLQAERGILEFLLLPVREADVPPQQAYALLKRSWQRLERLGDGQPELSDLAKQEPELSRLVEQAFVCLRPGDGFSIEQCDRILEQVYQGCIEHTCVASLTATVRATQAQVAIIRFDYRRASALYDQAASTDGLALPLQWQYQLYRALALEEWGQEFMQIEALEEAIALYEERVLALAPRAERMDDWATTQHHLGRALSTLGQRQRGTWLLDRAIQALRQALTERDREAVPQAWAETQNSLGLALGMLAQRHADSGMLEQSVEAFESALEVHNCEADPQTWAMTQNNLAAALLGLGQRNKDKVMLKRASDAFKSLLPVWTREWAPLDWAMTMDNLGTALRLLGEHRKGTRTLEQSVAAYRSALSVRTREHVPEEWAKTQNNLGAALFKLGEREETAEPLEGAIKAYENALREWTRERAPTSWAMTLGNQAAARKALAKLTGNVELVRQALSDFTAIGNLFRSASHAQYYELVVEQIALLRKLEKQLLQAQEAWRIHSLTRGDIVCPESTETA